MEEIEKCLEGNWELTFEVKETGGLIYTAKKPNLMVNLYWLIRFERLGYFANVVCDDGKLKLVLSKMDEYELEQRMFK